MHTASQTESKGLSLYASMFRTQVCSASIFFMLQLVVYALCYANELYMHCTDVVVFIGYLY